MMIIITVRFCCSTVENNYDEKKCKGCRSIYIYSRTCVSQRTILPKCHRLLIMYWLTRTNERTHEQTKVLEENEKDDEGYPLIMSLLILEQTKQKSTLWVNTWNTLGACSTVSHFRFLSLNRNETSIRMKIKRAPGKIPFNFNYKFSWWKAYIHRDNRTNIFHLVAFVFYLMLIVDQTTNNENKFCTFVCFVFNILMDRLYSQVVSPFFLFLTLCQRISHRPT